MTTAEPTAAKGITLGRKEKWARRGPLLPALIFTIIVVAIALAGSLWVMFHLNTNMMPMTADDARHAP